MAGRAKSGSASLVPTWRTLVEVKAAAACPTCLPARRNIETLKAVAVAPPPGTIFPMALPASCDVPITNQLLSCNAIRLSSDRLCSSELARPITSALTRTGGRCGSEYSAETPRTRSAWRAGGAREDSPSQRPPQRLRFVAGESRMSELLPNFLPT